MWTRDSGSWCTSAWWGLLRFLYHSRGRMYTWPVLGLVSCLPIQESSLGYVSFEDLSSPLTNELAMKKGVCPAVSREWTHILQLVSPWCGGGQVWICPVWTDPSWSNAWEKLEVSSRGFRKCSAMHESISTFLVVCHSCPSGIGPTTFGQLRQQAGSGPGIYVLIH